MVLWAILEVLGSHRPSEACPNSVICKLPTLVAKLEPIAITRNVGNGCRKRGQQLYINVWLIPVEKTRVIHRSYGQLYK